MTTSRAHEPGMTADAFLAWSEAQTGDVRYELLDGEIFAMSAERAAHVRVKTEVHRLLADDIRRRQLTCEAFSDGMAVRVDNNNILEPDALVRCGARLSGDDIVVEDPLIVVEVASPSTQRVDALIKSARYFRNPHIVHYVIVIPASRTIIHHRRDVDGRIEVKSLEDGRLLLEPPGIELAVPFLFREV